jgi:hypothetical protein
MNILFDEFSGKRASYSNSIRNLKKQKKEFMYWKNNYDLLLKKEWK